MSRLRRERERKRVGVKKETLTSFIYIDDGYGASFGSIGSQPFFWR